MACASVSILVLCMSDFEVDSGMPLFACSGLLVLALLLVARRFNDFLERRPEGSAFLFLLSIAFGTAACIFSQSDLVLVFCFCLSFMSVLFVCMWMPFLGRLTDGGLLFVLSGCLPVAGAFLAVSFSIPAGGALPVAFFCLLVSCVTYFLACFVFRFDSPNYPCGNYWDKLREGRHGSPGSLFLTGLAFGSSGYAVVGTSSGVGQCALVVGAAFLLSSLALFVRVRHDYEFEVAIRRCFALFFSIAFLSMLFVREDCRPYCAGFSLLLSSVLLVVVLGAMAKTARWGGISPIWIVGVEGAILQSGVFVGVLVLWWSFLFSGSDFSFSLSCFVLAVLVGFLQTFLVGRRFLVAAGELSDEAEEASRGDARTVIDAAWRARVDVVARRYRLSEKERKIIEMYARGNSMKNIADRLTVSLSTVKTHIYHAYTKLGVHSRQELRNLIDDDQLV